MLRYPHQLLMFRIRSLGDNLTAHDAAYVARARALNTRLATGGRRLASAAARRVDVETV